ncbi:MAG: response regulator transcription factor [Cyclobacteriaceae bacterium]
MSIALKLAHPFFPSAESNDEHQTSLIKLQQAADIFGFPLSVQPSFTFSYRSQEGGGFQLSSGVMEVLGYNDKHFKQLSLAAMFRMVHPEDRNGLLNGMRIVKKNLCLLKDKKEVQVHFGMDFRCLHHNGSYLRLFVQCMLAESGPKVAHFLWTGLGIDIHFLKPKGSVSMYYADSRGRKLRISNLNSTGRSKISFSRREFDVLRLLAQGLTSREIEDRLNISQHTVRTHRRNMHRKCKVDTTAQLIKLAITEGLL